MSEPMNREELRQELSPLWKRIDEHSAANAEHAERLVRMESVLNTMASKLDVKELLRVELHPWNSKFEEFVKSQSLMQATLSRLEIGQTRFDNMLEEDLRRKQLRDDEKHQAEMRKHTKLSEFWNGYGQPITGITQFLFVVVFIFWTLVWNASQHAPTSLPFH